MDENTLKKVQHASKCAARILEVLSTVGEQPDIDRLKAYEPDMAAWRSSIGALKGLMPESSESYFMSIKSVVDPALSYQLRLINAVLLLDIFLPQRWRLLHSWLSLRVPVADCSIETPPDNAEVLEFQKLTIEVKTNYLALCSGRKKSDIAWCICHIVLNICSMCIALCEFVAPRDAHEWASVLSSDFILAPEFVTGSDAVFLDEGHRALCESRWTSRALERIRQFKSSPNAMSHFSWDAIESEVWADLLQVVAPNLLSKYHSIPTAISGIHGSSTSIPAPARGSCVANPSAPVRTETSDSVMDDLFGPDPNPSDSEPSAKALGKRKITSNESTRRKRQPGARQADTEGSNGDPALFPGEGQVKRILEGLQKVGALAADIDPSHPPPAIYDALKESLAGRQSEPALPPMNQSQSSPTKPKRPNVYATGRNQTGRIKWTAEEDRCLQDSMKELYSSGQRLAVWSTIISWHGELGTRSTTLMQRNPVALKDRARNIIIKTRAQRQLVPDYLSWVKVNEPSGSGDKL